MISKLTEIAGKAILGENIVLEDYVAIGENAAIGHHVIIHSGVIVGGDVRIDDLACLGKPPMDEPAFQTRGGRKKNVDMMKASTGNPEERCIIGKSVKIGSGTAIYRGAHVGDNCQLGDNVCVREAARLAADCVVGAGAVLGKGCRLGQGSVVGENAVISAGAALPAGSVVSPLAVWPEPALPQKTL